MVILNSLLRFPQSDLCDLCDSCYVFDMGVGGYERCLSAYFLRRAPDFLAMADGEVCRK